jgi:hypothetical protein
MTMKKLSLLLLLIASPVQAQGLFQRPPEQVAYSSPPAQQHKVQQPPRGNNPPTAVLLEAFIDSGTVATAEPGDAGWVSAEAVIVSKRKEVWLAPSAVLEKAPSKDAPHYLQFDGKGWTLWVVSPRTRFRPLNDGEVAVMAKVPVAAIRYRIMEK